jgi:dipeptide/tripeptide permease
VADEKATWRFPKYFWSANVAELFERAAYYGVFIGLVVYLTRNFGFSDVGAGFVGGWFAFAIYLLPLATGALADKMGFRRALILAFGLLALGYAMLGFFGMPGVREALGETLSRIMAVVSVTTIALGGAIVKPAVSGTAAKASNDATRARAFSIFYQIVNIGAFMGKSFAEPLRTSLGLEYVAFYSAIMGLMGMVVVYFFFHGVDTTGQGKSLGEIGRGFWKAMTNLRFMTLILIVAGFWLLQGQLYAAMPKYVLRTVGEHARPGWLANVNPAVVILLVVPITHMVRKLVPVSSIGIALLIIPLSPLVIALSPVLAQSTGLDVEIFGLHFHPVTIMMIFGIAFQGLAECFLSPRYYEFASKQAPKGEEGLYMGYSHIHTAIAWPIGFVLSGYLLEAYCPDPTTLPPEVQAQWEQAIANGTELPAAYAHAHYLWYYYVVIGLLAFGALIAFKIVTDRIDRKRAEAKAQAEGGAS